MIKIFLLMAFAVMTAHAVPGIKVQGIIMSPSPVKAVENNGEGNLTQIMQ